MKKSFWILLVLVFSLAGGHAQAQRRVLPLIDLVNVPASIANAKALTSEQVRAAIIAAALAAQWDVEPMSDGSLKLSLLKDMEYSISMRATYSASSYSLIYVSSENLKTMTAAEAPRQDQFSTAETLAQYAEKWRSTRGATQPEFKFAIDRKDLSIHPTYELLVYELSAGVRRHLRLL